MKHKGLLLLTALIVVCPLVAFAQDEEEYVDSSGKYKISLLGDWRSVSYSDAVGRKKTEFIYRDRSEGLLKIRKESLNGALADLVRQEEENARIYRSGFERSSSEAFGAGALRGMRLSFYNTEGNRQIANTYYYLQDGNAVWVFRFTGRRGSLDTNRNLTDQIVRSFKTL